MPNKNAPKEDASEKVKAGKQKVEKEMSKMGLNYRKVVAAIIIIIGALLIITNLSALLLAFIGFVLIYFGLKMLGYHLNL
jgi:hypothetical protein